MCPSIHESREARRGPTDRGPRSPDETRGAVVKPDCGPGASLAFGYKFSRSDVEGCSKGEFRVLKKNKIVSVVLVLGK